MDREELVRSIQSIVGPEFVIIFPEGKETMIVSTGVDPNKIKEFFLAIASDEALVEGEPNREKPN